MIRAAGDEVSESNGSGGNRTLHVGGAARIKQAFAHGRLEGWRRPARSLSRTHHIDVARKDKKGSARTVRDPGVGCAVGRTLDFKGKARRL